MEIRVLRYFLTVAREGGINRAAEILHITGRRQDRDRLWRAGGCTDSAGGY